MKIEKHTVRKVCDVYSWMIFVLLHNRKQRHDYVYEKGEYQSTLQKIKHYLRRETKVNKSKVLSYYETLR